MNRASEAEQILSSNHGKVRYEDIAATDVNGTNNWDKNLADTGAAAIDAADSTGRQITDTGYVGRRPADDRYDNVAAIDGAETNASNTDRVRADLPAIDAANSTGREITDTGYADRRPVDAANSGLDRVQLFGEVLRVHKERISRGEVRVRKDVVTENQSIEVPVTREELVLERVGVPGNTPAPSAKIGNPQEIRVPLSEDKVRLEKQPVVREEVLVGKREVEDVARVGRPGSPRRASRRFRYGSTEWQGIWRRRFRRWPPARLRMMQMKALTGMLLVGGMAALFAAAPPPAAAAQSQSATSGAAQQSDQSGDLAITRNIRRAIIKDKSLSMDAHNITIITKAGKVTLKGRVKSDAEKQTVESAATNVAGPGNVSDELTVSQ